MQLEQALSRQKSCAQTLIRSFGLSPVMIKSFYPQLLDGHYINPRNDIVFFKTSIRKESIDTYSEHIIEENILNALNRRWQDGNEVCYMNFFPAGKLRTYDAIIYNIGKRLEVWQEIPFKISQFAERTYGGNGTIISKRIVYLEYDEVIDHKFFNIEIPKQERSKKPQWKPIK